jgi:hypothetical protein
MLILAKKQQLIASFDPTVFVNRVFAWFPNFCGCFEEVNERGDSSSTFEQGRFYSLQDFKAKGSSCWKNRMLGV